MREYTPPPQAPIKIDKLARKFFIQLYNILKETDRWAEGDEFALSVLSQAYSDLDKCREELEQDGLFYTSKTMRRKHPATELQKELIATVEKFTTYFKFAPRFREKMENVSSEDPVELLRKKYATDN
jgi:P27 family predicted phage terminase small subunit